MKLTPKLVKAIQGQLKANSGKGLTLRPLLERSYSDLEIYVVRESDQFDDSRATTEDAGFIGPGRKLPLGVGRKSVLKYTLAELSNASLPDNMGIEDVAQIYHYLELDF